MELGSGTGITGIFMAAHGCLVHCTDLEEIATGILQENIDLNRDIIEGRNNGKAISFGLDW